jgi:MYXO-CTERM domain-containing protein
MVLRRAVPWFFLVLGLSHVREAKAQTTVTISTAAPAPTPKLQGPAILGVTPGTPVVHTFAATGQAPITFSATGLPSGVTLDGASGRLSGSVASAGRHEITVTATNAMGMNQRGFSLVVGDTLALTPPRGWNSYDSFDDSVNETEFLAQAAWVRDNLKPFGWEYVVVDFRWYDPNAPSSDQNGSNPNLLTDANGRYLPPTNRFPSATGTTGFTSIAQQVHAMGLKFGIHIMRGIPRKTHTANTMIEGSTYTAQQASLTSRICRWNSDNYGVNGTTAAGQAWYNSIFRQYAAWGVDFVKVDDITSNPGSTDYWADEVAAIRTAIAASGRSIVLSLSPGETPVSQVTHLVANANMWRMSDDFWDRPNDLSYMFTLSDRWRTLTGPPGHWPDADMLPLGHLGPRCPVDGGNRDTRFTRNQQVTMLTLWAVLPSPLMLGANGPQTTDNFMTPLLTNDEVLAVHGDALGARATRLRAMNNQEVWVKNLAGGAKAVGLFNRATTDATMSVTLAELGLTGMQRVRDAWRHMDLPMTSTNFSAMVPGQAALLFVVGTAPMDPGTGGAGGMAGMAGAAGAGSGTAGMGGMSGGAGAGGASAGAAGSASGGAGAGGAAGGVAGAGATSGASGTNGTTGGTSSGGASPTGGTGTATGGVATGGQSGGVPGATTANSKEDPGCGCVVGKRGAPTGFLFGLGLAALALQRRRRSLGSRAP